MMGDETRRAIGVFWDIENCNVPRFASALCLVQRVRERFFSGLREAEFMCVCDINKESKNVIEDLNNGQVNVVHINATSKNAADDKIRQSLRRFADTHPPDTKVVLISSDVNFAPDLSDLRHRKHMYIILIHQRHVHEALLACANEHYDFEDLFADLPLKAPSKNLELVVRGYPAGVNFDLVKKRLRHLSYNCGGRVGSVDEEKAVIIFSNTELLNRARKRMEGEDVMGGKITTNLAIDEKSSSSTPFRYSPSKYHRNNSPAALRPYGADKRHHSPAPGAPGEFDGFATKQQRSSSAGRSGSAGRSSSTGRPSSAGQQPVLTYNRNLSNMESRITTAHKTEAEFIGYVCDMVQYKPSSPTNSNTVTSSQEHQSLQQQYQAGGKGGKMSRNMLMMQQQRYQEQQENENGSASGSLAIKQPTIPGLPTDFSVPPPPLPHPVPGFDSSVPLHGVDSGGVQGTLNISKTVNYTYQSSFVPSLPYPRPMYPTQQFGGTFTTNALNVAPIPRPRMQMKYIDRPISRSSSSSQGKLSTPRAIVSSTPDVFGEDDEGQEDVERYVDSGGGPVDLYVSNLDYNISSREWRKILASTFQPQVQVLGIFVRTQADNTSLAVVKVASMEDARFAISQFHRRKIGYKRIHVSLRNDGDQAPAESTRVETISVLSDAKDYTMPVFKFIEQYEKRYHKSVSVSDLYKMKDVVEIIERGGTGRMVRLSAGVCPTPSPQPEEDEGAQEAQAVCPIHCPEGSTQQAEALSTSMLPNVRLQRKHFSAHVHSLLLSHNGVLQLMSFPICYSAEFGSLPVTQDSGVPLEHLLSCVPGVEIKISDIGTKVIHFQENKEPPGADLCGRASPMLSQQMSQISREIGDLLRQSPHCLLPASKFIPSYHHHFGKQCRVADYGYTKLAELFDALPHVLQVLGVGDRKVLTLSHRAQVKRFITDLLKVLKSQPGKQLPTDELPKQYERALARPYDITHYGVAFLEDLFMDIPPTSVLITFEGNKTIMAIPKRDQTPEEMERTKQFALEVVDLLKHNPMCRMAFNKFIPAYHHHFGRQCRVADYGFTKLTDLFECISQVVEILEDQEERMLKLTAPEMRAVLSEQIVGLLRERPGHILPVSQLLLAFQRQYGFPLCLADYGVSSVLDLLAKIKHCVTVERRNGHDYVMLCKRQETPTLALRLLQLLMDQSGGCLPLVELCSRYKSMFGVECDVQKVQDELSEYVQVSTESDDGSALIRLTALQTLGRDIRTMLRKTGSIPLPSFSQTYLEHFSVELKPALYGYLDVPSLLRTLPHIVTITGRPGRKFVELSHVLDSNQEDEELMRLDQAASLPRFEDYLSAPVPSAVPSPELQPCANLPDLMRFEQKDYGDSMWEISEQDRQGLRTPLCRTPTSELLHLASSTVPPPPPPMPQSLLSLFPANVPLTSIFCPPAARGEEASRDDSAWPTANQAPLSEQQAAVPDKAQPHAAPKAACQDSSGSTTPTEMIGASSSESASGDAQKAESRGWWQTKASHSTNTPQSSITDSHQLGMDPNSQSSAATVDAAATKAGNSIPGFSAPKQGFTTMSLQQFIFSGTHGNQIEKEYEQSSASAESSQVTGSMTSIERVLQRAMQGSLYLSDKKEENVSKPEEAASVASSEIQALSQKASVQDIAKSNVTDDEKEVNGAGDVTDNGVKMDSEIVRSKQAVEMTAAGDATISDSAATTIKAAEQINGENIGATMSGSSFVQKTSINGVTDSALAVEVGAHMDEPFQPLDSSSTRSEENSGSVSPRISPRKTPRRPRLAAKFPNPMS